LRISMIRKLIILSLVLLPTLGFSQDSTKSSIHDSDNSNGHGFAFSGGVSFQKQFMGEVGLMYYSVAAEGSCSPSIIVGPKVASEFNFRFNNNRFIAGPKISYEADITILGIRANLIDYTDFKQGDICFTPEVGITIMAWVNVFYGYNIPLSSSRTIIPGANRITITINVIRYE